MKKVEGRIVGSGGGKGGGSSVSTSDDTLFSKSKAHIVDVLCEGPIPGFMISGIENIERNVLLDGTPLKDSAGNWNFKGVSLSFRNGFWDQDPVDNISALETEHQVGMELPEGPVAANGIERSAGDPVIQAISETDFDDLRVTISVPALYHIDKAGNVGPCWFGIFIYVKGTDTEYQAVKDDIFEGKSSSQYQRAYRIKNISQYGTGPWTVKVVQSSAYYNADDTLINTTATWASYTCITNQKFTWPGVAHFGWSIDAEQFGNRVPVRSYRVMGYCYVKIPSNYDPVARTYSGVWNGTFKDGWTDNPAWVWLDLASNPQFGIPDFDRSLVNKWALYSIAQYCDGMVKSGYKDGSGNDIMEPRLTCNLYLTTQEDAFHVLNALASAFRAMPYWSASYLDLSQDRPTDPTHLATPDNVINGDFNYSGTDLKTRFSVAMVTWNDPNDHYRRAIEVVEDPELIAKFGWKKSDVVAVGCTSRGQAHRFGKWLLRTCKKETETVTFKGAWEFADCTPGSIVSVQDPNYAQVKFGGRIISVAPSGITVDNLEGYQSGASYKLSVVTADKTVETHDVSAIDDNGNGTFNIWMVENFTSMPEPFAMWVLTSSLIGPRPFRVLANSESSPGEFEITALFNDINKYAFVDEGKEFDDPVYGPDDTPLPAPTDLTAVPYEYEEGNNYLFGALFSWAQQSDGRIVYYEVQKKCTNPVGAWSDSFETSSGSYDFKPLDIGIYTFRVRSCGIGQPSSWVELPDVVVGTPSNFVPDVQNLRIVNGSGNEFGGADCEFAWDSVISGAFPEGRFKEYVVTMKKASDSSVLRTTTTTDTFYSYTYSKNSEDHGGTAQRSFIIEVKARDIYEEESVHTTSITASNPAPSMSGYSPSVEGIYSGIVIDWSSLALTDRDLKQYKILVDTVNPPVEIAGWASAGDQSFFRPIDESQYSYDANGVREALTLYCKVIPFDLFGEGPGSNVVSGLSDPTEIFDLISGSIEQSQLYQDLLTEIEAPKEIEDAWIVQAMALGNLPDAYNAGATYSVDDYVAYNEDVYICILESTGNLPTNTTYWRLASSLVQTLYDALMDISGLDGRVTQTEADIDVLEGAIILKASQVDVDGLEARVTTAEIDIDGIAADILLKADSTDVGAIETRVSSAEIDIDGLQADILLKASQQSVTDLGSRVTTAELDIDGLQGQIVLKASQADLDSAIGDISTLESDVAAALSDISDITSDGKITPDEKQILYRNWSEGLKDYNALFTQCTNMDATGTTEWSDYEDAWLDLNKYLYGNSPYTLNIIGNLTTTTTLSPSTTRTVFNTKWETLYDAYIKLVAKLNDLNKDAIRTVKSEMVLKPNEWTVKIDANGNVAGMGLTAYETWDAKIQYRHKSESLQVLEDGSVGSQTVVRPSYVVYNNTVYRSKAADPVKGTIPPNDSAHWESLPYVAKSEFIIRADRFAIVDPDTPNNPTVPFWVQDLGTGQWYVGIDGDLIVDGSISADKLITSEIFLPSSNIKPDITVEIQAEGNATNDTPSTFLKVNGTTLKTGGRSWNLSVWDSVADTWTHHTFDVWNSTAQRDNFIWYLQSYYNNSKYFFFVYTHDEPRKNAVDDGSGNYQKYLPDALVKIGASRNFVNQKNLESYGVYVLVGRYGLSEGNGLEWCVPATTDTYTCAQIHVWAGADKSTGKPVEVSPRKRSTDPFTGLPVPVAGSSPNGLYITPDYMGYWKDDAAATTKWMACIKKDGTFYFGDGNFNNKYIYWNGSILTIRGSLNASDITTGALNASLITTGVLNADIITAGTITADRISYNSIDGYRLSSYQSGWTPFLFHTSEAISEGSHAMTWIKMKQVRVARAGSLIVGFNWESTGFTGTSYARVRVNGVTKATFTNTNAPSWVWTTYTVTDLVPNDTIEIWLQANDNQAVHHCKGMTLYAAVTPRECIEYLGGVLVQE